MKENSKFNVIFISTLLILLFSLIKYPLKIEGLKNNVNPPISGSLYQIKNYTEEKEKENKNENENKYQKSIRLGGEWFLNNQNNSFLYYQYLPLKKTHSYARHPLREMAALWPITKLSNYFNDSRYRDLAEKGFSYFGRYLKYDKENDFYFINITPSSIKLGYSAFMILSLLEVEHPKKDYYLDKFANGIIFQQNDDGSLRTFFYSDKEGGEDYYPGESLLALMSLYEYKQDPRYLNAVEKAFPYYVNYWQNNLNTAFVPWQTQAYYKLYNQTEKKEVADFIFQINDYLLNQHMLEEDCSGFDFSRGIVTSVYIEGINKAYELAKKLDDKSRIECYSNFIKEGLDFVLSLQIQGGEEFEKEAIGGFLQNLNAGIMRVDRNQHSVMALMDAYELGLLED
jgi:hypothetical protein